MYPLSVFVSGPYWVVCVKCWEGTNCLLSAIHKSNLVALMYEAEGCWK